MLSSPLLLVVIVGSLHAAEERVWHKEPSPISLDHDHSTNVILDLHPDRKLEMST